MTDTGIPLPQCPFPGTVKDTQKAFGALFFFSKKGGGGENQVGGALGRKEVPQPASGEIFPPLLLKIFSVKVSRCETSTGFDALREISFQERLFRVVIFGSF